MTVRELEDVKSTMREAHKQGAATWTAKILLREAHLSEEARKWLMREYPEGK